MKLKIVMAALLIVSGCAGLEPRFQPGSSQNELQQIKGKPAVVLNAKDGGTIWQYPEGPLGVRTFVARFDVQGKLLSYEQVLDEEHFSSIGVGRSTIDDVRTMIGPPMRTMEFERRGETAWDYLFRDTWGYRVEFSVIFAASGVVVGKFANRLDDGRDGGHH